MRVIWAHYRWTSDCCLQILDGRRCAHWHKDRNQMQYEQRLFMQKISDAMWPKLHQQHVSTGFSLIAGKHHSHFYWLCKNVVCGVSCGLCVTYVLWFVLWLTHEQPPAADRLHTSTSPSLSSPAAVSSQWTCCPRHRGWRLSCCWIFLQSPSPRRSSSSHCDTTASHWTCREINDVIQAFKY